MCVYLEQNLIKCLLTPRLWTLYRRWFLMNVKMHTSTVRKNVKLGLIPRGLLSTCGHVFNEAVTRGEREALSSSDAQNNEYNSTKWNKFQIYSSSDH